MVFHLPKEARLLLYIGGVYGSFLYWAFLQEKMFSKNYELQTVFLVGDSNEELPRIAKWSYFILLNTFMALWCCIAAAVVDYFMPDKHRNKNLSVSSFIGISFTCAIASPLSYESLKYISYPLMALTKAAKPIPVMVMGSVLFHKKYPIWKYISVLLLVFGIAVFSYYSGSSKKSKHVDASIWSQIFGNLILFIICNCDFIVLHL